MAPRPPPLPALGGVWTEPLGEKASIGTVVVPLGATEPRPVVVAFHGSADRAEYSCGEWLHVTHAYPFIVCPRGTPVAAALFSWGSVDAARLQAEKALEMVRAKWPTYVSQAAPVYVGFSQGAEMVVFMTAAGKVAFSGVFVHEGGYRQAGASLAALAKGERPLVVSCSTYGCKGSLPRPGPHSKGIDFGPHGHGFYKVAWDGMRLAWTDFAVGMPGWEGFIPKGL